MSRVRNGILGWWIAAAAGMTPACAQYPGHIDTSQPSATHLRATAVLEYTGDLSKIKESRLVPIAVWDGVEYQPGGLYLAEPAPLAVLAGTQYELEADGKPEGFFNVKDAEDLAGLWIGVGGYEAPPAPGVKHRAADSGHAYVVKDVDPDKPHFAHVPPPDNQSSVGGSTQGTVDSDHPTLHSRSGSDSSSTDSGSNSGAGTRTSSQPEVDPDRPTFHRRTDAQQTAANTMPVDPDRPRLSYVTPDSQEKIEKPDALFGIPADMKQIAGVSDSNATGSQSFAYSWANPDDAAKMQAALEAAAQQAVAPPALPSTPATKKSHARPSRHTPPPPALPALADEEFHVYGLTFGGGATMVLTAHTVATSDPASEKFVTIIAQPDFYGHPQILLKQVASADDLDAIPRMLLVDAVDTEGNGRGDLIFELRGQTYRQFTIYRVADGQATQVFTTQPTPLA